MAIFGPKPWFNPFKKNVNFSTFLTCCFYSLERLFFVLEYRKRHFPSLYSIKRKSKNWPFLEQNNGLTPFKKYPFFDFLNFMSLQRRIGYFLFQNIVKDIFLALIALKKKVSKMAIFGPKPWVNPFGKMSIFRLFELLVFIAQKGVFSFQNIVKDIFLAFIA